MPCFQSLAQSISAEGEGKIRSFTVSTGFIKTPLALNQIPAQAAQRGITQEEVVRDVMLGKSRIKEMMDPVEVANQFIYGFSKHARYLVGGDLLAPAHELRTLEDVVARAAELLEPELQVDRDRALGRRPCAGPDTGRNPAGCACHLPRASAATR